MQQNQIIEADMSKKIPLGVKILGSFNLILPGVIVGLVCLVCLVIPEKVFKALQEAATIQKTEINFTVDQLRLIVLPQLISAIFFIITSVGIFKRKDWARKALVYYSFLIAALMLVGAILKPQIIPQAISNLVHPGLCVWYFTSKNVLAWFEAKPAQQP